MSKNAIHWISAIDDRNYHSLMQLQKRMSDFYANSDSYYNDIDFNNEIWNDKEQLAQQDILDEAAKHEQILEIGCGKANIIKDRVLLESKYHGIDFSEILIQGNKMKYPAADFRVITDSLIFPYEDEKFDMVFSHFVIEHTVFPNRFLDESIRVLKPGGLMIILCPDFMEKTLIPSQKVGKSQGSGREKLKAGRFIDALQTGIDSKIRIPRIRSKLKKIASESPRFFININPMCFFYPFHPDVDAVYITCRGEIQKYAAPYISWELIKADVNEFCKRKNIMFLKGIRK